MIKTKRPKNRILSLLLCFVMTFCVVGCGTQKEEIGEKYQVYYLAEDGNSIIPVEVNTEYTDSEKVLDFLIECLISPTEPGYQAILNNGIEYNGVRINDYIATIDFTSDINQLPTYKAVLIRAALTRTLTQIDGINAVSCTVNGNAMVDSNGVAIGPMHADNFIENAGAQINPDEQTTLTLYFASDDGDHLIQVKRSVTYSSNIALDKLVVEQLLLGPGDNEEGQAVMNPLTKIISVTTQDGTCYVNLDGSFLTPVGNVTSESTIYSIVDSLVELGSINKVQFYINGESNVYYMEKVYLNTQFVRNLDLVE